jgi:PAS domain S-box-containing protein
VSRALPTSLRQLRTQLLLVFLLATMLPVAISLAQVRAARAAAEGQAETLALHGAQLIAAQVVDLLDDLHRYGHFVEQTPSFWSTDDSGRNQQLSNLAYLQPSFNGLLYFTPDLQQHGISNPNAAATALDLSSRSYAQDVVATHSDTFGDPVIGARSHTLTLPVAIALQPDPAGQPAGFMAAGIAIDHLATLWSSLPEPPGSAVMLLDGRDGRVLAASGDSVLMPGATASSADLAQIRDQRSGWTQTADGRVLRTPVQVEGAPWYVVVDLDDDDIYGAFDAEAWRQVITALGVGMLAFGVLALLWWRFATRLGALERMAMRWSRGDWSYRSGISGPDELGNLACAFDTMAEQRLQAETALRETERQQTDHLNAVIRAQSEIAQAELDPTILMDLVSEHARELTGAMGAGVATLDGEDLEYVASRGTGVHVGDRTPLYGSLTGECARTGQVLHSDETETDSRVKAEFIVTNRVRSMIVSPLRYAAGLVGVVAVVSERPHAFSQNHVRTMQLISGVLGVALGRAQAFAEQRRAEAEASALLVQLTAVLGAATEVAIIGVNLHSRISFFSEGAQRMLGYSAEEVIGKSPYLFHDREEVKARLEASGAGSLADLFLGSARWGEAQRGEWTYLRKDASRLTVLATFTPMHQDGQLVGYVAVGIDITDRKVIDTMKDEFVSIVSHEVRTPLTAIRGSLGLMAGGLLGALPERAERMLDIAMSNTERLERLVNDMLDLERMQSGEAVMRIADSRLADVMLRAVEVMQASAQRAGIRLVARPLDIVLRVDAERLLQVLVKLIGNAIKFSETGTRVSVEASLTSLSSLGGAAGVRVDVVDQGRGIPAEQLESIFERFRQVDASDSRAQGGSGLGLAICRMIVEQHGGRIWAASAPEGGSTLSFELPLG